MAATVGSLMDAVHVVAWDLVTRVAEEGSGPGAERRAESLVAAWPGLAAATLRVLSAVEVEPAWMDSTGSVRPVLAELAHRPTSAHSPDAAGQLVDPDSGVVAITTRLGLIADLLAGESPARLEADQAAAKGLHANVLAVVHAVATATVGALADRSGADPDRRLLQALLVRSERFALPAADQRRGRYDDAVAPADDSLDGALANWVGATVDVLGSRHRVTQAALQVTAGDALIVTATAATVCAAAFRLGVVPAERATVARAALTAAHAAWRPAVSWPATVRLDGVRDLSHIRASQQLRQTITDSLRERRDWLPADMLADRFDVGELMGSLRRGVHGVHQAALAHCQAMDRLVRGPGRLWIAAGAITQPAYRTEAALEAARHRRWVPMPPWEPAGAELLTTARLALTTTTRAVAALDATALRPAPFVSPATSVLRWEQGRVVARPVTEQPSLFETVRTPGPSGRDADRRTPIPLHPPHPLGPRR